MFQLKCAYWDPSGFQEVLPWLGTLAKVQYHQYMRSQKILWTLITQKNEGRLANRFPWNVLWMFLWDPTVNEGRLANRFPRNILWMFLWDPTVKRQYPKSPPPQKKNSIFFGLGRPVRHMLLLFQDDRTTTVQQDGPILKLYHVQRRHAKLKSTTNYQLQKWYFLGVRETSQDKTTSSQRL